MPPGNGKVRWWTPWPSVEERLWRKVVQQGDCWVWTGAMIKGYGTIRRNGKDQLAHRAAYEMMVAEIPEGLTLDHLCRNPPCVNPYHMDPVPLAVNASRAAPFNIKAHCKMGHPLEGENLLTYRGRRDCRTCTARRRAEAESRATAGPSPRCHICGVERHYRSIRRHVQIVHDLDMTRAEIAAAAEKQG